MTARSTLRGQPVLVLATILGGWTVARVLFWTSPFPEAASLMPSAFAQREHRVSSPAPAQAQIDRSAVDAAATMTPRGPLVPVPVPLAADPAYAAPPPAWLSTNEPLPAPGARSMRRIAGQYMLLAAGFSNMALPPEIAAFYAGPRMAAKPDRQLAVADRPLLGSPAAAKKESESRWSADGWLLWRGASGNIASAPGAASYGRSQAGAVVRYRLVPGALRLQAYARVARSLQGARQAELAAGLSLRPVPSLPVRVAVEGRATDSAAGRKIRPAAFAVTELAPARLPLGLRGEAYAQAGYVGGDEATAFVDGQARVDGKLARLGEDGALRAGLGAWGGAQKGAARLDIGPSAAISFRLGEAQSRIAVDYRLRIAGEAEPGSGPALTFSAGF